jgi:hypothetical protein
MRKFLVLWLLLNLLVALAVYMPSPATAEAICPPAPACILDCRLVDGIFGKSEGGTVYCWFYTEPQGRTPRVPGPPQPGSLKPTNEEIQRFASNSGCETGGCGATTDCYPAPVGFQTTPNSADITKMICEGSGS